MVMRRGNNNRYTKLEKEDPSEKSHREAQFLIYKTMKQADQMMVIKKKSSKPNNNNSNSNASLSWLKLRICKLKVRIGNKFLRLRKTILCNMSKTKVGVSTHFMGQLKCFKRLFVGGRGGRRGGIGGLPQPLFTI